jgi:hypothetical protein
MLSTHLLFLFAVCFFEVSIALSAKLLTIFPTASTKGIVECNADGVGKIKFTLNILYRIMPVFCSPLHKSQCQLGSPWHGFNGAPPGKGYEEAPDFVQWI